MKRISLDVWIQLIGMLSIVFSLLFVGLQMQQSQTIALASQQQARTEVLVDIIGEFDEGDKSFVDLISGIVDGSYFDDSNVVRDAIWQIWMLYENDFLQYKLGLMDDEVSPLSKDSIMVPNISIEKYISGKGLQSLYYEKYGKNIKAHEIFKNYDENKKFIDNTYTKIIHLEKVSSMQLISLSSEILLEMDPFKLNRNWSAVDNGMRPPFPYTIVTSPRSFLLK